MAVTADALADLRFLLRFAAERFQSYAEYVDLSHNAELFHLLAFERQEDAADLDRIAAETGLNDGTPMMAAGNAGLALGMGMREPPSASSAAFRVQRAENTLGRMAAQLRSLASQNALRSALGRVRDRISERSDEVRQARRRAQRFEGGGRHGAASKPPSGSDGHQVKVWFATNRQRGEKGDFPGVRSNCVTYGHCYIFVPKDRRAGSLGRGLFGRLLHGDNRVRVQDVKVLRELAFWSEITCEIEQLEGDERQALIFIHGYNTKFEDAARRTAQLKVDLSHKGPAAFFSWPSLGYLAGYSGDEAAIEGSEKDLRTFLIDFAQQSGAEAIHIIAHSMGNRGLLRAVDAISQSAQSVAPVRFGQIFLAAPDVDAQLFAQLAKAYSALAERATLYVTRNDKAVGLSKRLHRFARAGLAPPVSVVPGIDTIDASNVNLGLLGHSYAPEMRPVLADIHRLINDDIGPDHRFGLRRVPDAKPTHWEFAR